MIHEENTAPRHEPPAEETPHGCYRGLVFIGHLVEDESGEELEVVEPIPCRRCSAKA